MLPGDAGPVLAREGSGTLPDPFDVVDALMESFARIYVVDLDGVERNNPQLEYLQEIARDAEIWVDAGVPTADQAIDVLVTGAQRVVLGSAYLESERELKRAWKLSTDLVVDLETVGNRVSAREDGWKGRPTQEIAAGIRALGPPELVLSFRPDAVRWELVSTIAPGGPTWVGGTFQTSEAGRLGPTGAQGGIFHITDWLSEHSGTLAKKRGRNGARDDEA